MNIHEYFHMIPLWKSPIKLPVEPPVELPVEPPVEPPLADSCIAGLASNPNKRYSSVPTWAGPTSLDET